MRRRLLICGLIGLASGTLCWFVMRNANQGAGDFWWAIRLAGHVLDHKNPYDTPLERYPVTAAFFAFPLLRLSLAAAAGVFFGISSGLLAFGLTRDGYVRLLVFLAFPYWAAFLTVQWSPLIAASSFFPLLLPATMAKPQIGLPVALTHLTRRGAVACIVLGLLSLALMPRWPLLWLGQARYHEHFIPLLVLPGPLLAIALWRWRERDAWLLFLAALMPQRWFYDCFFLWLIPKSRREIVVTAFLSWICGLWRWYHIPSSFAEVGRWTVLFIYLPMLGVLLARAFAKREIQAQAVAAQ